MVARQTSNLEGKSPPTTLLPSIQSLTVYVVVGSSPTQSALCSLFWPIFGGEGDYTESTLSPE